MAERRSAWERMCELKAGSDLIRRVGEQPGQLADRSVSPEEKLLSASLRAYTQAIACEPQSSDNYYKRGYMQYGAGKLEEAIADFSRAVEIEPLFADGWAARGNCYFSLGQITAAINDFRRAAEVNPGMADCYFNLGNAERSLGHNDTAIAMYTRAIAINCDFAGAYCNRASIHKSAGHYDKAIQDLTCALEECNLTPEEEIACRVNRADANFKQGMLGEAIGDLSKAIRIDPKCVAALALRAGAFVATGPSAPGKQGYELAEADASAAIEQDGSCCLAYYYRGQARHQLGQHAEGLDDLKSAVDLCDDDFRPKCLYMRGCVRDELGDVDGATADFVDALCADPELHDLSTRDEAQDPEEAENMRRKIEVQIACCTDKIKSGKGDTQTHLERGQAYLIKKQYNKALTDFGTQLTGDDAAEATKPEASIEIRSRAYASKAESLLRLGQITEAIEDARVATELSPDLAEAWTALGSSLLHKAQCKLHQEAGQLEGSTAELAEIRAKAAEDPEMQEAIRILSVATGLEEQHAPAFVTRARAYFHSGNLDAAFADWKKASAIDAEIIGKTAERVMDQLIEDQLLPAANAAQLDSGLLDQQVQMLTA